jgi:ankyrin repeat protein
MPSAIVCRIEPLRAALADRFVNNIWTRFCFFTTQQADEQAAMLVAVTNGDNETFQSLLNEDGDNIHFKRDEYKASLLHFAAWKGSFSLVEFLVSKGIHASVKDNRGTTPLHWVSSVDSSTSDQAKIVQLLLIPRTQTLTRIGVSIKSWSELVIQ